MVLRICSPLPNRRIVNTRPGNNPTLETVPETPNEPKRSSRSNRSVHTVAEHIKHNGLDSEEIEELFEAALVKDHFGNKAEERMLTAIILIPLLPGAFCATASHARNIDVNV